MIHYFPIPSENKVRFLLFTQSTNIDYYAKIWYSAGGMTRNDYLKNIYNEELKYNEIFILNKLYFETSISSFKLFINFKE